LISNLTFREGQIIQILEKVYSESKDFSLIGGYAVDAYSPLPRFSVDCDLVIAKDSLSKFDDLLKQNGYDNLGKRTVEDLSQLEV
jgi:hypothetical protein